MELEVYNIKGEKTSRKIALNDSVFNVEPNDHAIYLDAKQYLANQRQGTHDTKEKGDITGSTRKLKRQKGTGTARMGSIKSPILRGGGRAFGPHPRNYSFKLNKKLKVMARKSALTYKARENQIIVIEDFSFDAPKTKAYAAFLKSFELLEKKTLLVFPQSDNNIHLSMRNLAKAQAISASSINTYDILNANKVFIMESSLEAIERLHA